MAKKVKAKRTITGAQQYSSPEAAKKLEKKFHKDLELIHNNKLTRAEFKKKYGGKSVGEIQALVYAIDAEARKSTYSHKKTKDLADKHQLMFDKDYKEAKQRNESDKGRAKGGVINRRMGAQDYRKGGLTLNTVDNRKKK